MGLFAQSGSRLALQTVEDAITIVRFLSGTLPRVALQELQFNDYDPRIIGAQDQRRKQSKNSGAPTKRIVHEARKLDLKDGHSPYQGHMWQNPKLGVVFCENCFPQGSHIRKLRTTR